MPQKPRFSQPIKKQTMAEQVATTIKESILAGEWLAGQALPTEPELAEQLGVSRTVVRDATRMLAAQGLVEAQHGRGVFVTESQVDAFGDALLLALRRSGATVWDVEHFEQILYPEVFALAAAEATDEEIEVIHQAVQAYLNTMRSITIEYWDEVQLPAAAQQQFMADARTFIEAVFAATHNQVLQLLATPLLRLRNLRNWQDEGVSPDDLVKIETAYYQTAVDAIDSRDPQHARETMSRLMALPPEAETAMRQTPIGEVPVIPIGVSRD